MKRVFMIALLTAVFFACKKDDIKTVSTPTLSGIWEGKWGDVGESPTNFIKFEFKANGTMARFNEQGQVIASGTWTVSGINFECTYTHASDGQVHKIAGLYTDFNGGNGPWGYGSSKANGGTIDLKKQ